MNKSIKIGGVNLYCIRLNNAISEIESFIKSGTKHQVCITNVYSVIIMQKDKEFKKINNSSSLILADGMPLVWASKLYEQAIPERIAGYDLFYELCKIADKKQYKFFFLGSTAKTVEKIFLNLKKQFPNLQIVGAYSPPFKKKFSDEENSKMVKEINKTHPDILWVGMTAPKQEKWIYHNLGNLNLPVAIGVGAVFDFITGNVKRAPRWMQKVGLEWLFRLIQEPRRLWKRYLISNTIFILLLLKKIFQCGQWQNRDDR